MSVINLAKLVGKASSATAATSAPPKQKQSQQQSQRRNDGIPKDRWVQFPTSSCLSWGRYNVRTGLMRLVFRNSGREYVYHGVDYEVWAGLYRAGSRGGYYNRYIKGQFI